MSISVKEAADAVGMSKAAVFKAIRMGKISAEKNQNGEWRIEPVELFRVFDPVHSVNSNGHSAVSDGQHPIHSSTQPIHTLSIDTLRERVAQLERMIGSKEELIAAKDDTIAAKDDALADLRARLNVEQEERRRLSMLLAAPTTQPTPPVAPTPAKPKGFWQRLTGRV